MKVCFKYKLAYRRFGKIWNNQSKTITNRIRIQRA